MDVMGERTLEARGLGDVASRRKVSFVLLATAPAGTLTVIPSRVTVPPFAVRLFVSTDPS
jgi:hypothetical protein